MKKTLSITILILTFSFSQAQISTSKWQKNALLIDGYKTDWEARPGFFNGATGVLYETRNDSSNMYLVFEIPDHKMQMKIMRGGFKIIIAVKAKPKVKAFIDFPVLEGNEMKMKPGAKPGNQDIKQDYLLMSDYAEVLGFLNHAEPLYRDSDQGNNLAYNVNWDEKNAMIIEIRIPYNEIFSTEYALKKIADAEITITTELKGLQMPSKDNMQGQVGIRPGGAGGGGMNGGGRSGGGRPGGSMQGGNKGNSQEDMQEMQVMSKNQSFKYKFKLSQNN